MDPPEPAILWLLPGLQKALFCSLIFYSPRRGYFSLFFRQIDKILIDTDIGDVGQCQIVSGFGILYIPKNNPAIYK